jgi:hypothetical protein
MLNLVTRLTRFYFGGFYSEVNSTWAFAILLSHWFMTLVGAMCHGFWIDGGREDEAYEE